MKEVSCWDYVSFKKYSYDIAEPEYTTDYVFVKMGMLLVNTRLISTAKYGYKASCGTQLVKIHVGSQVIYVDLADFNKMGLVK